VIRWTFTKEAQWMLWLYLSLPLLALGTLLARWVMN